MPSLKLTASLILLLTDRTLLGQLLDLLPAEGVFPGTALSVFLSLLLGSFGHLLSRLALGLSLDGKSCLLLLELSVKLHALVSLDLFHAFFETLIQLSLVELLLFFEALLGTFLSF